MNYEAIKKGLETYDKQEVNIYISYLQKLENDKDKEGKLKNKWFPYFTEKQAIDLYEKVAIDELFIDGDTITIAFKGAVMVNYNYQAYKNKLLKIYPNTKFDIQNVYRGDTFSFKKESGKVMYTHEINDPFELQKEIIGTYCIIKNERGEFIETLNMDEIKKMRNVAKTQDIWNVWEGEMILKSVIKRACKRHFKDVVVNIEVIDNDNYDIDNVNIDSEIQEQIENCTTLEDLGIIYSGNKGKVNDEPAFLTMLTKRKLELKKELENDNS